VAARSGNTKKNIFNVYDFYVYIISPTEAFKACFQNVLFTPLFHAVGSKHQHRRGTGVARWYMFSYQQSQFGYIFEGLGM
jgi:hypothetical protein